MLRWLATKDTSAHAQLPIVISENNFSRITQSRAPENGVFGNYAQQEIELAQNATCQEVRFSHVWFLQNGIVGQSASVLSWGRGRTWRIAVPTSRLRSRHFPTFDPRC